MVYKTEDTIYGYKLVYVCKTDKSMNLCNVLRVPKCLNIIHAIIKIEIPKGTTIVNPCGQAINEDSGYHKLRCERAKFVKAVKYYYIYFEEKINKSESKIYNTINEYIVEISEKEVIDYNESKDIEYCSMYTYINSLLADVNILKPNDIMVASPYLNTDDYFICAPGIHFFKTEKEAYNYLLCLHS